VSQRKRRLIYAPDDADRRKHKDNWQRAEPGFVYDSDGYPVGKCPNGMDMDTAQGLLDGGISYAGRNRRSPFPESIYNVHGGVPYRAHQKAPGKYHGFPERASRIPPRILQELRKRAEENGHLEMFERWQRDHGDDEH
jgi:hypothetical protein